MTAERLDDALDASASTGVRVAGIRVASQVVTLAGSIAIARALGPEGRGLVALPVAILAIVTAVTNLGIQQASVYLAARGVALRALWAAGATAAVLAGIGAAVLLVALRLAIGPSFLGGLPAAWIVVVAVQIPIVLAAMHWTGVLQIAGALRPVTKVTFVAAVVSAALAIALAVAGELTPFRALLLTLLGAVVALVGILGIGIRWYVASFALDRHLFRRAVGFGVRAQVATAFLFLLLRVDQVLVRDALGFRALGLYALAVVLAEFLWLVTDAFAASLLPHQVHAVEGDERRLGYAMSRLALVASGLVCVVAWIVAPYAIELAFGSSFAGATSAFRWLLPGVVAIAAQRPLYTIVTRDGRIGIAAAMNAAALAANVVLNLWLLPDHGIVAAAFASTATYLALGVGYVLATRRAGVAGWLDLVPRGPDLDRLRAAFAVHRSVGSVTDDAPANLDEPVSTPDGVERVDGCPLCRERAADQVTSVAYADIWAELEREWGARFDLRDVAGWSGDGRARLVRCRSCGLEYVEDAVVGDAAFYERLMAATPYHGDRWEFDVVAEALNAGDRVVDLGCGDGAFVRLAATQVAHVVGLDHNAAAVEALRRDGFEATTARFEPFSRDQAGAFDVACSFHAIEHLRDADALIAAAVRCVRPGGRVFVSTPNRDRMRTGALEPLDWPPHHVSHWSSDQFSALAERHGLELVEVRFEEPDLSHVRLEAFQRMPRSLRALSRDERSLVAVTWMHGAVGPRRYARAVREQRYSRDGRFGHSMLAEFRVAEAAS